MFRFRLMLLVITLLLLPQGVFAETLTVPQTLHAQNLIHRKMRLYHHYNVQVIGDTAWFFAFHKKNHNIPFGWYRLDLKKKFARAERVLSSSEFSMLFQTAFSPDGKEAVVTSKTGEIIVIEFPSGRKTTLGAEANSDGDPRYMYPVYTPDGRHIILHDALAGSLVMIDATTKNIASGRAAVGFWISGIGGGEIEEGQDISLYEFSEDGRFVTFIGRQVLDLLTFTKQ